MRKLEFKEVSYVKDDVGYTENVRRVKSDRIPRLDFYAEESLVGKMFRGLTKEAKTLANGMVNNA